MIFVFDTNVFLQTKDPNLWELMALFPSGQRAPCFLIGIDRAGEMEREAEQHAIAARSRDPEAPIVLYYERLDGSGYYLSRLEGLPNEETRKVLHSEGCVRPIEPQLFAVAEGSIEGIIVTPNQTGSLLIPRDYLQPDVLRRLHKNGIKSQVRTLSEALTILKGKPTEGSPTTINDLRAHLAQYRFGHRESEESLFLEFKEVTGEYLTRFQLQNVVAAVSAMLNSLKEVAGGWVFIGISDSGEVRPFSARYKSASSEISLNRLLNAIRDEIDRIRPIPGLLVEMWAIPDGSDERREKCVVAIYVRSGGNQEYVYREKIRQSDGREKYGAENTMKWIRPGGPRTVPDPHWQR